MVKTKKKGDNYHDRHAVLYLGFTLTVLGRHRQTVLNRPGAGRRASFLLFTSLDLLTTGVASALPVFHAQTNPHHRRSAESAPC